MGLAQLSIWWFLISIIHPVYNMIYFDIKYVYISKYTIYYDV